MNTSGGLDELLERTTIRLPFPIRVEELKDDFLKYLAEKEFDVSYTIEYHGRIITREEYPTKVDVELRRGFELSITFIPKIEDKLCTELKFDVMVPGYDSVEDFQTMSSGKEKLKLIDDIRVITEGYFSQRPK